MKFTAETTATVAPNFGGETELSLVITAYYTKGYPAVLYGDYPSPEEAPSVEILRVEVRDSKTRTLHLLPEYLVDVLTDNDETHDWLLSELAEQQQPARDDAVDARRNERAA